MEASICSFLLIFFFFKEKKIERYDKIVPQLAVCSPIILARAQPVFEMMESLGISYDEFSANEL